MQQLSPQYGEGAGAFRTAGPLREGGGPHHLPCLALPKWKAGFWLLPLCFTEPQLLPVPHSPGAPGGTWASPAQVLGVWPRTEVAGHGPGQSPMARKRIAKPVQGMTGQGGHLYQREEHSGVGLKPNK